MVMTHAIDTVVVLDISGGMSPERTRQILKQAMKETGLLITFDTKVQDVIKLEELTEETNLTFGGGTMLECVAEYFKENILTPRKTMVFTDGYITGSWDGLPENTNWIIIGNPLAKPPYGNVFHWN